MKILVINSSERGGGAEQMAADLVTAYRERGHRVRWVVGRRRGAAQPDLHEAEIARGRFAPFWLRLERLIGRRPFRGQARLLAVLRAAALPQRAAAWWRGDDNFANPASFRLADSDGDDGPPDIIHAHNLHGDYFDLRALPQLTQRAALVWTLHDGWALSGHCAYAIDCRRWLHGCGSCPDLRRTPAIRRDGTAANWQLRRSIAAASALQLALPSHWLQRQVEQSIWRQQPSRVIANGVDLRLFQPGDRAAARAALGIPPQAFVVVFNAAHAAAGNPYKDTATVEATLRHLQQRAPATEWWLLAVGNQPAMPGVTRLRQTGYLHDRRQLVQVYQAADALLHAAHAENHPLVVLEALACGLPVVATAVGGISEQVVHEQSGLLAPRAAAGQLASHLIGLAQQPQRRAALAAQAAAQARQQFGLDRQAAQYLDWFAELVAQRQAERTAAAC